MDRWTRISLAAERRGLKQQLETIINSDPSADNVHVVLTTTRNGRLGVTGSTKENPSVKFVASILNIDRTHDTPIEETSEWK